MNTMLLEVGILPDRTMTFLVRLGYPPRWVNCKIHNHAGVADYCVGLTRRGARFGDSAVDMTVFIIYLILQSLKYAARITLA